jgi:polyisoprenoid-binding protein YceI
MLSRRWMRSGTTLIASLAACAALLGGLGFAVAATQGKKEAPKAVPQSGNYEIDPVHSSAYFKIKHMGISNFYGRFDKVGGKVTVDAADPTKSTIQLVIDAGSVNTNSSQRDTHLKSPDFFNVAEFPQITFESDKITAKGGDKFEVTGAFKLHGVEETITVPVEMTGTGSLGKMGTRIGYETRFTIQRSTYDMNYDTSALSDDVEIVVSLEAVKK